MTPYLKACVTFLVTRNIHKFVEARYVLNNHGVSSAMLRVETREIQDDNIDKIAIARAVDAVKKCNIPLIVEDAGLFIKALNTFPGPYSSYTYKTIGLHGILKLMRDVEERDAEFQSTVAYFSPFQESPKCFHGVVGGEICHSIRGDSGFGFDPIFKPKKSAKTFGEMSIAEKSSFSHRAQALEKFVEWYKS